MVHNPYAKVTLDASVVIKLLLNEKDSGQADTLFDFLFTHNAAIIEPTFLKIEVFSVVRKKEHLKEISRRQAKTALELFNKLRLEYVQENSKLLEQAYKTARLLKQTVIYDSLYLTIAKEKKAFFITGDARFLRQAEKIYRRAQLLAQVRF